MAKKKPQMQRKTMRITLPKNETFQLIYFQVFLKDGAVESVKECPDFPEDNTEENSYMVGILGVGFGLHLTCYPEKPPKGDSLRTEIYIACMEDLQQRIPELREALKGTGLAYGHVPEDAIKKVEWHTPTDD